MTGLYVYYTLQVAHMTKSEMAYSDASLLGPGALFLNQYFNCPIPEKILLYLVCVSKMNVYWISKEQHEIKDSFVDYIYFSSSEEK